LNFIFEVLEISTNVRDSNKASLLLQVVTAKHRFDENYADDIHKYTKYIDEVVAEQQSRFLSSCLEIGLTHCSMT